MQMSDAELASLRARCLMASQRGYSVARADQYMEALASEAGSVDPPSGSKAGSAAHLAAMASEVMAVRGGKKPAAPKKVPEPPKSSPKAPPKAAPKTAPAPALVKAKKEEKPKVKETVVPVSYDTWSYDELYAEAQKRDIPNRSKMSKEELVAVLEANDAE